MLCDMFTLHHLQHFVYSCPDKWIASVGRTVISRCQRLLCDSLCHKECSDRDTTAKCLGTCHNIRFHTVMLPCKHFSGSSHAALDLIQDQKYVMLIAKRTHTLYKCFCCRINSTLTLYCLKNNSTGFVINQSFYAVKIIKICKFYSGNQWFKRFLIMFIACHRQCTDTSSMKRMVHCDDLMSCMSVPGVSIFLRRLDCSLDCLCTAVGKENTIHPACF